MRVRSSGNLAGSTEAPLDACNMTIIKPDVCTKKKKLHKKVSTFQA